MKAGSKTAIHSGCHFTSRHAIKKHNKQKQKQTKKSQNKLKELAPNQETTATRISHTCPLQTKQLKILIAYIHSS